MQTTTQRGGGMVTGFFKMVKNIINGIAVIMNGNNNIVIATIEVLTMVLFCAGGRAACHS